MQVAEPRQRGHQVVLGRLPGLDGDPVAERRSDGLDLAVREPEGGMGVGEHAGPSPALLYQPRPAVVPDLGRHRLDQHGIVFHEHVERHGAPRAHRHDHGRSATAQAVPQPLGDRGPAQILDRLAHQVAAEHRAHQQPAGPVPIQQQREQVVVRERVLPLLDLARLRPKGEHDRAPLRGQEVEDGVQTVGVPADRREVDRYRGGEPGAGLRRRSPGRFQIGQPLHVFGASSLGCHTRTGEP